MFFGLKILSKLFRRSKEIPQPKEYTAEEAAEADEDNRARMRFRSLMRDKAIFRKE